MSVSNLQSFKVMDEGVGLRLDVFLAEQVGHMTRSQLRKLIDDGSVTVNGEQVKSGYRLEAGDQVDVTVPEAAATSIEPVAMDLPILFEDEHIIIVNKPIGLVMHPGAGTKAPTLVQGLLHHTGGKLSFLGEHSRPGIVHRLDRDTSGVVVCAKTDVAHVHLANQFEAKTNFRQYVALLDGFMRQEELTVKNWLARDPMHRTKFRGWPNAEEAPENARHAVSHFKKVTTYQERLSQVSVQLETGRTHQIRVHALNLGLPVVGDMTYHRPVQLPETFPYAVREALAQVSRQLLHARYLGIEHPVSGKKLAFEAPLPQDFQQVLDILEEFRDS